ncbi:MAG TPA: extracellular solute-binding protein [Roseiarcus sp.]|nr:extracellular solute-binding protein [Roseiarcus sp.]
MDIILNGMTWSHKRGYAPLAACSELWRKQAGVEIRWDKRSLQDFEAYPIEELARRYDLIVIDHPHVGQVARENCLAPFDGAARAADREALARASVGPSYVSYGFKGRQWALPIDAATQVQAWRPDLVASPPALWDEAVDLARNGMVLCPLRPPHSLMVLYTLSGNLGRPCAVEGPDLIDAEAGAEAFERIRELAALVDARCFAMDPIDVFEAMADADSPFACAPLVYGYVSYTENRFRANRIGFADIPALGSNGPVGSALGGTGIAVSALSAHKEAAADFAYWVASADVQAGLYAASGGQPAHAAAWESDAVNAPVADFYRATRRTLEGSWLRPRHDGYMPFQDSAARLLNEALQSGSPARETVRRVNALFRASFAAESRRQL